MLKRTQSNIVCSLFNIQTPHFETSVVQGLGQGYITTNSQSVSMS
jgi:hypothetical protein